MNFQTMNKQRKFILIAAAVGFIAMFLPWFDLVVFSINGMHDKGIIVFICFVVAGAFAYLGDQTKNLEKVPWFITLICGAFATILMIWFFMESTGNFEGSALGIGFYLAGIAAIAVLVSSYLFRAPGDDIKSGFDSLKDKIEQQTKSDSSANP
jgi:hypothetical protein